jgi:lysyl-tRNA synthetase, class II
MLFKIDPRILREYPGVVIGVVAAHNINNKESHEAIKKLFEQELASVRENIAIDTLLEHPHIVPWHNAYKQFGAKPKKYLPSIENLLRRALKGEHFGSINPLVDLYNIISLRYLLPAGGEDLATISGNIELAIASDTEKPILLLGESEARAPQAGEVIYKDDNGAICRRWNWKEAARTKLTENTQDAILVFEALAPVTREIVEAAINQAAAYIEEFCGGSVTVAILDEHHPEVVLKSDNAFVDLNPKSAVNPAIVPLTIKAEVVTSAQDEQYQIRVEKVKKMQELGIDPWPQSRPENATSAQVQSEFSDSTESREYQIAGRILTSRMHGKAGFVTIQDEAGKIQLYLREDMIGEKAFSFLNDFIDIGDIIWCRGKSFRTKMGEVTVKAQEFVLLSKCLYPLPEKFHGIADREIKYRQRYLDLITSPEDKDRFIKRSHIVAAMRSFFNEHGFLEVETPMLHPIPGGAAAKPFMTHHNALGMDLYLRIAPELYLKRLVVGGLPRVYEINRNFRNEGISIRHNPEFTMLEYYIAHHDYIFMMEFTEKLLQHIAQTVCGQTTVQFGDYHLNFAAPFERLTMQEAVARAVQCNVDDLEGDKIDGIITKHKIHLQQKNASWGYKLTALFEELVESTLIQPTFITQFPIEVSPLSKRNPNNPNFADRFELYVAAIELSNGFSELNNPFDQAERFHEQSQARAAGEDETHFYDADYVQALEYGLPPTVGCGIGIDRLTMFLTNAPSIRDVILFPTLRMKE